MSYSSELKTHLQTLGFKRECCMLSCCAGYEARPFTPVCEHCTGCYLRGVFFRFGYLTPPEKDALLTFDFDSPYAFYVQNVLSQTGFPVNVTRRRGHDLIYLKKSEAISDFVALMGATKFALHIMEVQVDKQCRAELNRKFNAETANLTRTANAAAQQLSAIKKLQQAKQLPLLSPELQAAAKLRLDHPEASLEELRAHSELPVSRSGLNHRLQKLTSLAAELQNT